jgi:23S rRNA-/tRNA-specific pseudouridylate synthase
MAHNPENLLVLFENTRIIAVHKPPGLATQAPSGIDSLEVRVRRHLSGATTTGRPLYLGVPHRLDRPVSGAIVFAKDKAAARNLAEQFRLRAVEKRYWALLGGTISPGNQTWSDWMRKVPDESRSEICDEHEPGARYAVLHVQLLRSISSGSAVEIQLETGRSHQIRLQGSTRGLPVHGDADYGSKIVFGPRTEDERLRGIALHARSLTISDPQSGERLNFVADVPACWHDFWRER